MFKNVRKGVVLVAIVKNEGLYLNEFICYYKLIGFNKIILYDNGSTDNTREVVQKYVDKGFVELHSALGSERQKDVYNDALNKYGHIYKYFCFFDIDEFLKIQMRNGLAEIEKVFTDNIGNNIGAIAVNMLLFGTSGYLKRPHGLVIENYIYRAQKEYHANYHTKCIVDSLKVLCIHNPHTPFLKKNYNYVSCNGNIVGWTKSNVVDDSHLILYHYYTKSKEEYEEKKMKGDALQSKNVSANVRTLHSLEELDSDVVLDKYMHKYIGDLKTLINDNNVF